MALGKITKEKLCFCHPKFGKKSAAQKKKVVYKEKRKKRKKVILTKVKKEKSDFVEKLRH